MKRPVRGLFGMASLGAAAFAPAEDPGAAAVTAWIASEPAGAGQAFTAFVRSETPFSGRYELVAERNGPAGRSSSRQGGTVQAAAGAPVQLSRTALAPLGPEDRWTVSLKVFRGDDLVATDEQRR